MLFCCFVSAQPSEYLQWESVECSPAGVYPISGTKSFHFLKGWFASFPLSFLVSEWLTAGRDYTVKVQWEQEGAHKGERIDLNFLKDIILGGLFLPIINSICYGTGNVFVKSARVGCPLCLSIRGLEWVKRMGWTTKTQVDCERGVRFSQAQLNLFFYTAVWRFLVSRSLTSQGKLCHVANHL